MSKDILVVSAHAADWVTRCGGTLLKYVEKGYKLHVIILTYGIHGESRQYWRDKPDGNLADAAIIRRQEIDTVAKYLNAEIETLEYEDYVLTMDEPRIRYLIRRILEIRPQLVFTHWIEDTFNSDHATTSNAVIRAISAACRLGALPNTQPIPMPDIFLFESSLPVSLFNHFEINTYVDITDVYEKKIEAVKCFYNQPELPSLYDPLAAQRAKEANDWVRTGTPISRAEGFNRYIPYVGQELPLSDHNR
ncbi:MAG: PIG-L family deacetylase [Spirochaetales bacterium]|nr:PIG-L family deacetylase [Spirochaetales bacterium]